MVAKSYQGLEIISEPFVSKGRSYVQIRTKKGEPKTVRWYSATEYAKLYPEVKESAVAASTDPYYKTQKQVLGFDKGYITIFKGDTYANLDWYRESSARYAKTWGWYFISTDEVPEDVPNEPVKLFWEDVGNEDGSLKNDSTVKSAVDIVLYDAGVSEFQGRVGDRIEVEVVIDGSYRSESNFGSMYTMHIMRDNAGNEYVWTTSSKSWPVGEKKTIRGTVKEHRTYKNIKQSVLTRCVEVSK